MDPILLIALALFIVLVAAWIVLPSKRAAGVSDQDMPAPAPALQS
jgi:hypothetical protein